MHDYISSLHITLKNLDKKLGGDIAFIQPINENIHDFESSIDWKLPNIFKYFYYKETNGIIIDNKRIYSIYDKTQKKTWVENLSRMNNPETSPWFNGRPNIFKDYLIIGNDNDTIFCLSKKYDISNPSIYICKNSNSSKGVDLNKLNLDLEALIIEMVKQAFEVC